MRRLLAAIGALGLSTLPSMAASPLPTSPSVDSLIEKLAADSYSDRETASRALVRVGISALPALDRVVASSFDAEARDRATLIAEQIRRANEGAKMLIVAPVRLDYVGVPLATALADLKAKTGVLLTLDIPTVKDPLRTITLKTELLPPWQAVEEFCRAAGLRELFRQDAGPADNTNTDRFQRRRISYSMAEIPQAFAGNMPIVLTDGTPDQLPGDRTSAVRVVAMPPGFIGNRVIRGAGEVVMNLDVTPLPGLRWQEVSMVRVTRAEDETGRPIGVSFRPDDAGAQPGMYNEFQQFGGQVWIEDGYGGMRQNMRPNPRVVPVKLRTDDRAITRLKYFEGSVVGEVSLPNQTLMSVENLAKSGGISMEGANDTKLTIVAVDVKADGRTTLRVRTECPNPWTMQRLGMGNRMWKNQIDVPSDGGIGLSGGLGQMKFFDAAGKAIRQPVMQSSTGTDDGFRQSQEMELVFSKEGGTPVKMLVVGSKILNVEVPFRMVNVQLP